MVRQQNGEASDSVRFPTLADFQRRFRELDHRPRPPTIARVFAVLVPLLLR
jgi:hypothetical protein